PDPVIGSTSLEFLPARVGQSSALGDPAAAFVNVLDFIPHEYHDDIRNRVSTVDVSSYVQSAIDYAGETNGLVFFPSGVYRASGLVVAPTKDPLTGTITGDVALMGAGGRQSVIRRPQGKD